MREITLFSGWGRGGEAEAFAAINLRPGEIWTIVGNTGSGKSRLIKDIEQLADGDSVTGRRIWLDGEAVPLGRRREAAGRLISHLGQNMRFVLDAAVEEFVQLHARCRGRSISTEEVLELANDITPEPIVAGQSLNQLSGGQTRALMIADTALIGDSPIVLIDEIENAGIDKEKAFGYLQKQEKLVLVVTHDPHTALMAPRRIVLQGGAVRAVVERSVEERRLYEELTRAYHLQRGYQSLLRKGEHLL